MPFEYRDHTGESWIVASGSSLEEAFGEGAKALFNLIVPLEQIEALEQTEIFCEAETLEHLFFEWLNRLILIKDVEGLVFSQFQLQSIYKEKDHWTLKAVAEGELFDAKKHKSNVDVKAATFSELMCRETTNGYEVGCVLDI